MIYQDSAGTPEMQGFAINITRFWQAINDLCILHEKV